MTQQATTLTQKAADLKEAFRAHFGVRLNARVGAGSMRHCLSLVVPSWREQAPDRARLAEVGAWLESTGYWASHDYQREGRLSGASCWTCWNGAQVYVRSA